MGKSVRGTEGISPGLPDHTEEISLAPHLLPMTRYLPTVESESARGYVMFDEEQKSDALVILMTCIQAARQRLMR
ncbi:MAG: hypothetical protein ACM3MH_03570, partial [Actinomycetota bacterium]